MSATQPAGLDRTNEQGALAQASNKDLHKAGTSLRPISFRILLENEKLSRKASLDRKGEQVWYSFYDQEIAKWRLGPRYRNYLLCRRVYRKNR